MGVENLGDETVKENRASEISYKQEKDFDYKLPDKPGENNRPEEGSDEYHGLSGSVPKPKKSKTLKPVKMEANSPEYHGLSGTLPKLKDRVTTKNKSE